MTRIIASLVRPGESIEIDNLLGQEGLKRAMAAGQYEHGKTYERNGKKYQFLVFRDYAEWARRCL